MMERWGDLETDGARLAVTIEREFPTDPADLWQAITDPERAGRWLGSLALEGDKVTIGFAGGSSRSGQVLECDSPHRLRVVLDPGSTEESFLVATLEATAAGTKLSMHQDGLPPIRAALFTAGWQHHAELLDAATGGSAGETAFPELLPAYRQEEARAVAGRITTTADGSRFDLERVIGARPSELWHALVAPARFDFLPQPVDVDADEAARRLTLSWPDSGNTVTFALDDHPAGTMLSLGMSPSPSVTDASGRVRSGPDFAAGWHSTVDALVAELGGIPIPEGDALWQAAYAVYADSAR